MESGGQRELACMGPFRVILIEWRARNLARKRPRAIEMHACACATKGLESVVRSTHVRATRASTRSSLA